MAAVPLTIAPALPVSRALALMRAHAVHEIPVVAHGRYRGMVSLDEIALRTNLPLWTKVDNLLILPPRLTPSDSWETVARELLLSGCRAAPVLDPHDRLLGLVSRSDVVRILPAVRALDRARADDIMSPLGASVPERAPVGTLIGQVRDEPPLAVVDRHGRLSGTIGISDLSRAFWKPKQAGKRDRPREKADRGTVTEVEARTLMRAPAVSVLSGSPVAELVDRMRDEAVSSVFVVRDGSPIGVVTQTDLLEFAVGGHPATEPRDQVFVRVHGFPVREDPELLEEVDRAVAPGLSRIRRRLPIVLLDLHIVPEGVHRAAHVTVSARLHTSRSILHARQTAWDLRSAVAEVVSQLEGQARQVAERQRRSARRRVELRHLHPLPAPEPVEFSVV